MPSSWAPPVNHSAVVARLDSAVAFATCAFGPRLMCFIPVSKEEVGKSAEVFPVAAGAGADLALVLGADLGGAVGVVRRCGHADEGDLTDLHARVERDREAGHVGEFERELSVPAGINETGSGVNEQAKAAEGGLAFESSNKIGGKTNALAGGPEHELTWVQHEGVVGTDLNEFGEILEVLLHIDVAHRVVPKHPKKAVDMKIDR